MWNEALQSPCIIATSSFVEHTNSQLYLLTFFHKILVVLLRFLQIVFNLLLCCLFHIFWVYVLCRNSFSNGQRYFKFTISRDSTFFALEWVKLRVVNISTRRTLHGIFTTGITYAVLILDKILAPWASHANTKGWRGLVTWISWLWLFYTSQS